MANPKPNCDKCIKVMLPFSILRQLGQKVYPPKWLLTYIVKLPSGKLSVSTDENIPKQKSRVLVIYSYVWCPHFSSSIC